MLANLSGGNVNILKVLIFSNFVFECLYCFIFVHPSLSHTHTHTYLHAHAHIPSVTASDLY